MVSTQEAVVLAEGPQLAHQASVLPPAREFLTSAGFGGAAALLAAVVISVVVAVAVWRASKRHRSWLEQQERVREDKERAIAVARCEQRFKWVVETAGIEPAASEGATLGLGPELALELLRGLHRDAKQLGDETLVKAITVYLNQFSLVLAQAGGPLSYLAARATGESNGDAFAGAPRPDNAVASRASRSSAPRAVAEPKPGAQSPQAVESPAATESAPAARSVGGGRRRRR